MKKQITDYKQPTDYTLTPQKINDILAAAPDYRQQALYEGAEDQTKWERSFAVEFKESEWTFLMKLLQDEIKQQKQLIAKTRLYPSDTIASSVTREKKQEIINYCDALTNQIVNEFF